MLLVSFTPVWAGTAVCTATVTGAGASRNACTVTRLISLMPTWAACTVLTWLETLAAVAETVKPVTLTPAFSPMNSISYPFSRLPVILTLLTDPTLAKRPIAALSKVIISNSVVLAPIWTI